MGVSAICASKRLAGKGMSGHLLCSLQACYTAVLKKQPGHILVTLDCWRHFVLCTELLPTRCAGAAQMNMLQQRQMFAEQEVQEAQKKAKDKEARAAQVMMPGTHTGCHQ